jgi:hypothetical protein
MPYAVSYDEDGIVVVTYSGSAMLSEHLAAFEAALRLCEERKCLKLLVDFSGLTTSRLSTTESFSFGEVVAKTPIHLRIAHVLPGHVKASQNVHFASTVESNRGKTTGAFETVEQARDWLLKAG